MARERDEDLKERDAFAQRMLEKDKAKQDKRKGIVSKSDKKGFEEVLGYFSKFHRVPQYKSPLSFDRRLVGSNKRSWTVKRRSTRSGSSLGGSTSKREKNRKSKSWRTTLLTTSFFSMTRSLPKTSGDRESTTKSYSHWQKVSHSLTILKVTLSLVTVLL